MRTCLFCAARADSVEDAWPKWITDQFKARGPSLMQAERRGVQLAAWPLTRPEITIRKVCKNCNNGWMSRLENTTKPVLQPLLAGQRCALDLDAQARITLWAIKTAMVLEGVDSEDTYGYTQPERNTMRAIGAIPWRTSVWLAASLDPSLFVSSKTRHLNGNGAPTATGLATTIGLAHIVLQVFTIRTPQTVGPETQVTVAARGGPWSETTVRVWPTPVASISWPPPMALNGEPGIALLAERFSTSEIPEKDLDVLTV